uniref:SusC/RagA family TonB-linked outer membrane protein n=1 Tax=Pedobacter schmidteae TaxID=2201271 RepID=UPI000EB41B72|nr:SusC/RagA family TonB-linked outer membrane protein [Pedobacter schmidteae]
MNHLTSLCKQLLLKGAKAILTMSLLFAIVFTSAAAAQQQEERITINVKNISIKEFITRIGRLSKLELVFTSSDLDQNQKITYQAKNKPLSQVLEEALKPIGLGFKIEKGIISIFRQQKMSGSDTPTSSVHGKRLSGQVIDAVTKQPLVGATISTPSNSAKVITQGDGSFSIPVEANEHTLSVSYVGYTPTSVPIQNKSTVAIHLNPVTTALDETVVTGMFTRKQSTYTGAVNTLKAEEIIRTGSLNIIEAIARLDPSFQLLVNDQLGSNPNAIPDIQMRGASSFSDMKGRYTSSPNQPLFIIDGFEQSVSRVFDMDINRIQSITLLKDATAKAIYGSKGANGVIVIETKKPLPGKLRVSYKVDLNVQAPVLSDYRLTDARQKLEVERLAGMFSSPYPEQQLALDQKYQAIHSDILKGVNTDWLAQPTRVGIGNKHSLSLDGGDESVLYSINVGYNNNAGVMKGSSRNSLEGGFSFQYRYKNLTFREQLSIISNKGIESPYGSFEDYAKMNPYWKMKDERGHLIPILGVYDRYHSTDLDGDGVLDQQFSIYNPMLNANTKYLNQSEYLDLTNNFYVEWALPKGFRFTGRIGITKLKTDGDLFYPSNYATLDPNSPYNFRSVRPDAANDAYYKRGQYTKSHENRFNLTSDIGWSYSKMMGKHLIFFNNQYTLSENQSKLESFKGQGFADNATSIGQARQYMENDKPFGKDTKARELGIVASTNYSYDSRYLLDANYRANASSLFGANNRWGHFWSIGAGWNVNQENFLKESSVIDNLKFRGSYGYTGSQNFESYLAMATYTYFNDRIYDDVIGANLLALSNPDLKWQQTLDKNVGVDLSVFKRFNLSFDFYTKTTSDLLTPIKVVPSTGFDNYTENLGKSENKGIEVRANVILISNTKQDIQLSVFGNLAHNKNKLLKIGDALSAINDATDKAQSNIDPNPENGWKRQPRVEYAEGESLSAIWGVRSLGIDPFNGMEVFLKKDGTRTYIWDTADKVVLGDELATVQGSLGFNLDYKGLSVSTNIAYRLGGQSYNQTLVNQVENADLQYNVDQRVFTERWNPETPGVPAKYKRLSRGVSPTMPSSRFIQNNNELKLSSLNIGYDFRHVNFIKNAKLVERLRISFAMNDLLRFSTVKAERGTSYPYARSFIGSIQATF